MIDRPPTLEECDRAIDRIEAAMLAGEAVDLPPIEVLALALMLKRAARERDELVRLARELEELKAWRTLATSPMAGEA